jgi:asparagine synthetase B (glutamine-hydrolysing)
MYSFGERVRRYQFLFFYLTCNSPSFPRLAILFSGGIDSMILAALADKYVPIEESIDLLNVAFGDDSFDVPGFVPNLSSE